MSNSPDPSSSRLLRGPVLVFAAQPGDEVIACGGALSLAAAAGQRVSPVVVNAASFAANETADPPQRLVEKAEASLAAAGLLGYEEPQYWREPAPGLAYREQSVRRIQDLIQGVGAALIFAPSSSEPRPDRFSLALAVREAVRRCSHDCALACYGIEASISGHWSLDIAEVWPKKQQALAGFASTQPKGKVAEAGRTAGKEPLPAPPEEIDASEGFELWSPDQLVEPLSGLSDAGCWEGVVRGSEDVLVSVVTRTTGREELAAALDSVAAQTYRSIELLLVDVEGRGALNVGSWCGSFPIRVVSTGHHLSRGAACNAGLDAAAGDYVVFLDDDDWFLPDHVQALVSALAGAKDARAAYAGIECRQRTATGDWEVLRRYNDPYDPNRLLVENYLPMHAVLFDRSLTESGPRFDESLEVYEDWDFWLQLGSQTHLAHVDRVTAVYRVSESSGFGLRGGDAMAAQGYAAIMDKWRARWSTNQLVGIARGAIEQLTLGAVGQDAERSTLFRLRKRIAELEREVLEYQVHTQASEQLAGERAGRIGELERGVTEYEAQERALEQVAGECQGRVGEQQGVVEAREVRIGDLERGMTEYEAHVRALEQVAGERDARIETLQTKLAAESEQKRATSQVRNQLVHRLDTFQTSAWWQLAGPLRAAESQFPRIVRAVAAIPKLVAWALTLRLWHRARVRKLATELLETGLFDRRWYVENNPDVVLDGRNPILHWLSSGWTEARDPNPLFDVGWYLAQNPDVQQTGVNPLVHYVASGAREGRDPNPLFDSDWYLVQNPDVAGAGINPLSHYLMTGAASGCDPNPLFDSDWYLEQNPDAAEAGLNPLVHYLVSGAAEGRDPSPSFDSNWYLTQNPDVAEAGINPLVHYVLAGAAEGRAVLPPGPVLTARSVAFENLYQGMLDNAERRPRGTDYVSETSIGLDTKSLPVRVIAFYLPQFHPIPENDAWWGKGFTEWANVSKAVPQFTGHYQPRLPDALGFYDLRLKEVQREQIRLARKYGIYGFCYHHYWFAGKRLLQRPFEQVLADASLDLPFCLCWANENWTRRWDGYDKEVLIAEEYSPEDDLEFIAHIEPALRDPRYIRIAGKPLLIVYRAHLLPDPRATAERWRVYCRERGLSELFLVSAQSFGHEDPREVGFDAAVEFPPHNNPGITAAGLQFLNSDFQGQVFDLPSLVAHAESRYRTSLPYDLLPTVMPSWDNEARRPGKGSVFVGSSPDLYRSWLTSACDRAMQNEPADKRLVFVNAWNEWAEGAYLEPDRRYGFAYLQATADVLSSLSRPSPGEAIVLNQLTRPLASKSGVLLMGHDAFPAGAQLNLLYLARLLAQRFGLEVVILLLEGGELLDDYRAVAEVHVLDTGLSGLVAAAQAIRRRGIDGAITNTVVTGEAVPILRDAGYSVVSLVHEMPELIRERGLAPAAEALAKGADRIVFAVDTVRQAFCGLLDLPEEKVVVLPQGIYQPLDAESDTRELVEAELGLPPDAILVMNAGYGDMRKGFDLFLDCARLVTESDPRFHFLWVGNLAPDLQDRYEHERRSGRLVTHLHQVSFSRQMARYYRAANVFLLTSREDPFPSVVLEALGCGLPVVAFEGSGGHCELLRQPVNGTLVAPLGNVAALAQALRKVAADEAEHDAKRSERSSSAKRRFDYAAYGWELLRLLDPSLLRVSVVVPNYNYGRYLQARLHSLFIQTYPVFEIIVLDDGSTDDSIAVIRRTGEASRRELRLEVNPGNSGSAFVQWAKGIRAATGDVIWIAEADDLAEPTFLESLTSLLRQDSDMAFAFCDSAQIDSGGSELGDSYAGYCSQGTDVDFGSDFILSTGEFLARALAAKNTVLNVSAVVFRRDKLRSALDAVETELPTWTIAGDWRIYVELCRGMGGVGYISRPLNVHRRHEASVVGSNRLEAHLEEIERMHQLIRTLTSQDQATNARQLEYRAELSQRVRDISNQRVRAVDKLESPVSPASEDRFPGIRHLDDAAWLEVVCQSLDCTNVGGERLPRFPSEELQRSTVGNAGQAALTEAFQFYRLLRSVAGEFLARPLSTAVVLDFGCGWGRHLRFLLRDCAPNNLWGSDVDPEFVALCTELFQDIGCHFLPNEPLPPSGFEDGKFDLVYSFSVFSHLAPEAHLAWARELARVVRPGGLAVITTQRRAFLDYCESLKQGERTSTWHETLAKAFLDTERAKQRYDEGEFLYVPSGGGGVREGWFYGEAVVPRSYFEKHWREEFEILDFIDDADRCPQAVAIARRRD